MKPMTQIICLSSLAFSLSLISLSIRSDLQAEELAQESALRAAFIVNFTKFVTFPELEESQPNRHKHKICYIGEDKVATAEAIAQILLLSKNSHLELLRIRDSSTADGEESCDIAFLDTETSENACALAETISRNRAVLSIAMVEGFASCGGIIELRQLENKYRFIINRGVAEKKGLRLSSQLLNLASKVLDAPA